MNDYLYFKFYKLQLQWHKNKEELPTNSLTLKDKPEILLVTTMDKVTLCILTATSTMEITLMAKEPEKENIFMPTETDIKGPLNAIKSMALAGSSPKIRVNTMVLSLISRPMGKWCKAWRRNLYIC